MEPEEKELDMVHEDDLVGVLKKIGFYEHILEGKIKCKFCNQAITLENLHSIFPQPDNFSFICDNPECVQTLVKYLDNKAETSIDLNI